MNSAFTPEEIRKFINNEPDLDVEGDKAEKIAEYLKGLSNDALNQLMPDQEFSEVTPVEIPRSVQAAMRKKVKNEVKGKSQGWQRPLLIAAALIGFIWMGHFLLQLTTGHTATDSATFDLVRKTVGNNTATDRYIHLPDGTGVLLKPKAAISYLDNFTDNRYVYMEGNARFDVVHDARRPFTVIANGIGTLDIGTSFWVNNNTSRQEITVTLLEGSIAVKSLENSFPGNNIYLQPGQQIKILKNKGNYIVRNIDPRQQKDEAAAEDAATLDKQVVTNWTNQAYSFSKSPLQKVFDQLSARYQVEIQVDPVLLKDREFTGKIMYSDSLNILLDAICKLNHLTYTRQGNTIQITQ